MDSFEEKNPEKKNLSPFYFKILIFVSGISNPKCVKGQSYKREITLNSLETQSMFLKCVYIFLLF